jgi:hypothetical protein
VKICGQWWRYEDRRPGGDDGKRGQHILLPEPGPPVRIKKRLAVLSRVSKRHQ